mgnify:FL=1
MINLSLISDDKLNTLRANAIKLLDNPKRCAEAEAMLDRIDAELKRRYLPGMIQTFLGEFPNGFHDEKQIKQEREYKLAARELCLELLGKDQFALLLANEDWSELFDRAKRLINKTNFIQPEFIE